MRTRRRVALLVALAAFAAPGRARAHPFDVFGYGSRAAALGGAYTALADGYEASYYNPAGVVRSPGVRLGVGYAQSFSDLQLNGEAIELRDSVYSGTSFGVSSTGRLYDHLLGLSLAFALPDRGSIRATTTGPLEPQFVLLSNRVQRAEILLTSGLELGHGLAIGGGLAIGASLGGTVDIDATLFPQGVDGNADISIKTRVFPIVGVSYDAWDTLRLGLTYRAQTSFSLAQPALAVIALTPDSEISADLLLFVRQTYFFSPHQIQVGVAYDVAHALTLSFDVMWADWSALGDPGLDGTLEVGGELGGLLDVPPFRAPEDAGFHDTVVPRFGAEYRVPGTPLGLEALRIGYAFEPSPAPGASGVRNLLDNDKHIASAGLGFVFRDPWGILLEDAHFDVHAQYFRFATREVAKSDPADPVGDLRFGGDRWVVGGMLTVQF